MSYQLKTAFVTLGAQTFHGKIEAGEYWIGDPCYPFSDDHDGLWGKLLETCHTYYYPIGTVCKDGTEHVIVAFPTKWGDGGYEDKEGYEYSVDAGLIGIMRAETATAFGQTRERMEKLGRFVTFESKADIEWQDGHFVFGTIDIETDDSKLDEEDAERWYCDEQAD